jgi:hypothetical protein
MGCKEIMTGAVFLITKIEGVETGSEQATAFANSKFGKQTFQVHRFFIHLHLVPRSRMLELYLHWPPYVLIKHRDKFTFVTINFRSPGYELVT